MFEIWRDDGGTIRLSGRLDASQADTAREVFAQVEASCAVDFSKLEYISSAGLSVLLETQRRLWDADQGLVLHGLSNHISDLFRVAGLDAIFKIE